MILKALQDRVEQDLQLALYGAWHTARLTNYSGKTFPALDKELAKFASLKPQPRRRQTAGELLEAMRAIKERTVH